MKKRLIIKIKLKYIMISFFVVMIILAIIVYIFYRRYLYYPDIQIKVSGLYDEHSEVVCLSNNYYKIQDGSIYNLDNQEIIYQTSCKYAFVKSFDDLLWVVDNSNKDNLKVINSSGQVVESYSIPDNIDDFFINDNVCFCISSDGIEIYRLCGNHRQEQISVDYSFVFESENAYFKLYKYSCEYGECLYFDMDSDNYIDSYFAVDSKAQNIISSGGMISLLLFESDRLVYTEALFQLKTLYEYCFSNNTENCYTADVGDYFQGFFDDMPYFLSEKYIISIAQTTTARTMAKSPPSEVTSEMSEHDSDGLYIINAVDCSETLIRSTRTFERILYADDQKAITYYNGKYLTYSLDEWEVIGSQSADEIQNGGSYTFESCGDYIFVFNDDTGELINRINAA